MLSQETGYTKRGREGREAARDRAVILSGPGEKLHAYRFVTLFAGHPVVADGCPCNDLRMKEHRKHPRFECEGIAEIHLLGIEKSCPARIEDLSLKGCKLLLLHEPEFDPGSVFELTFTVNDLSFRVRGKSTGIRGARHIGVEFVGLGPRLKRYVRDLVEELAAGGWKPKLQGAVSNQLGANLLVMPSKK